MESRTRDEEEVLVLISEVQDLRKKLGNRRSFEDALSRISSIVRDHLSPSASPSLRQAIYAAVSRVATVLQTRYTMPGFWLNGLRLFEEAEHRTDKTSEKEHLRNCIKRAREHLHEMENLPENTGVENNNRRYLFEGHLTVEPEPPPPAWLVSQNVLTMLAASQDWSAAAESSTAQGTNPTEGNNRVIVPDFIQNLINDVPELSFPELENVIEASLQEIGAGSQKAPPASKEVVDKLPVINVTEELIANLGRETECAVCRENLVVNDRMQEMPCSHLFHPDCLKPWLDENNSCPICRHELRTDDHSYESWKEREKEAEEESKGAANALRGGEYMYV